jgi:hypothetical protein
MQVIFEPRIRQKILLLLPLALGSCLVAVHAGQSRPANLLVDGNFEREDLRVARTEQPGGWSVYGLTAPDIEVTISAAAGRNKSRGLAYRRTQRSKANVHVDQIVAVQKNTVYEVSAFVRWEGKLCPILAVARMDWKLLGLTVSQGGQQWSEVRLAFNSFENEQVRLEWFPGAEGKLYTSAPGSSYLDDVCLKAMQEVPESLRLAFQVIRPKSADEIAPAQRPAGPVGNPKPLRPIICQNGILQYEDGGEVALWGANLQTALSWEYNGRLKPSGVPLQAEALKRITVESLDQLELMETQVIRTHLLPADFTDRDGNLVDTVFLDVLDHLIAQCRQRGIYVYMTLVNDMKTYYRPDSFMTGQDCRQWLFDETFVTRMERYIQGLLNHRNRYTGQAYRDEPAIAVFEVMNEPQYLDYTAVVGDSHNSRYRQAFDHWCAACGINEYQDTYFRAYRYKLIRRVVDRLAKAIRDTGSRKPVVWNLNWPRMILEHEDVFQAIADSTVDAVSFGLYPGQRDVPIPYWEHSMDLSGKNYLPFLRQCYTDYEEFRWLLGRRFAGKAKVTYEFETFFNQSSYLYPAMARLFRALGSQIAMMWQYTVSPAARYCGGSHYLSLDGSPQKALSFRIASRAFGEVTRYAEYDTKAETKMVFGHAALSYPQTLSVFSNEQALFYSRSFDTSPLPISPHVREIAGCGRSPLVSYEGDGAYFLRVQEDRIELRIRPDVTYPRPLWQRPGRPPWTPTCELDSQTPHRFAIHLPGWEGKLTIERANDIPAPLIQAADGSVDLTPGRYRISRNAVKE